MPAFLQLDLGLGEKGERTLLVHGVERGDRLLTEEGEEGFLHFPVFPIVDDLLGLGNEGGV